VLALIDMRPSFLVCAVLALGGCCANDPYSVEFHLAPETICADSEYFVWNGVTEVPPGYKPVLADSKGGSERHPHLEFFDATDAPVTVPMRTQREVMCEGGCPHTETSYDIGTLPPGDYTMVHRRKNASGHRLVTPTGDVPWGEFMGDVALVTTLRIGS